MKRKKLPKKAQVTASKCNGNWEENTDRAHSIFNTNTFTTSTSQFKIY